MPSFLDTVSTNFNSGKAIGLQSECKCGTCSFNSTPHFIMRPFIWILLLLAMIGWIIYKLFTLSIDKNTQAGVETVYSSPSSVPCHHLALHLDHLLLL